MNHPLSQKPPADEMDHRKNHPLSQKPPADEMDHRLCIFDGPHHHAMYRIDN
jgi:hypothetical protein